jgi:uncharacterized OsmC-like protein
VGNVRLDSIEETKRKAAEDPTAAQLPIDLSGEFRTDESLPQFGGTVKFARGEALLEGDFPPFLGGEGRTPSPLTYCFYGALCCYGSTFAMQAAMAGVDLDALRIRLRLTADFHQALGIGERHPLSGFQFEVEVETDASDDDVERIKKLADERCPAIWAMDHRVPYQTSARKV